jgi:hypothetical protein
MGNPNISTSDRIQAAQKLGSLRNPKAIPKLIAVAEDPDTPPELRKVVISTLEQIGLSLKLKDHRRAEIYETLVRVWHYTSIRRPLDVHFEVASSIKRWKTQTPVMAKQQMVDWLFEIWEEGRQETTLWALAWSAIDTDVGIDVVNHLMLLCLRDRDVLKWLLELQAPYFEFEFLGGVETYPFFGELSRLIFRDFAERRHDDLIRGIVVRSLQVISTSKNPRTEPTASPKLSSHFACFG